MTNDDINRIAKMAVRQYGAIQKVSELADAMYLLQSVGATSILEIGAGHGGALFAWHSMGLQTYCVDIRVPRKGWGTMMFLGDSASEGAIRCMQECAPFDVLFIDGDHSLEGVTADFENYSPMVDGPDGGLILLHDICYHPDSPTIQVDEFWAKLPGSLGINKQEIVHPPKHWGGIGVYWPNAMA